MIGNTFSLNGNTKPVRTVFHQSENGRTELYLTPAGISYFEDLNITTYYAYIILNDSQCNGKTLSVKSIEAAGYGDNFNEIYVNSSETPTTGTVNVLRDPEDPAYYTIVADLDFNGTIFSKATGYSGTVNIGTEGDTMTIDVTNYKNLNIYYKGP